MRVVRILMESSVIFKVLQFSQQWIDLGILTQEKLEVLASDWEIGEDQNPEHYRWRIFSDFLKSIKVLDNNLAMSLYNLGKNDPDINMGGSMMAQILRRADCPSYLIQDALNAKEDFLVKIATKKIKNI